MIPSANEPSKPGTPAAPALGSILWESAVEALVNAFLVLLLGGIALDIVGGLLHDMTPSLPPGMAAKPRTHAASAPARHSSWAALEEYRFPVVFGILFVLTCRARLAANSRDAEKGKLAAWTRRVANRLSEEWFDLIVANAFGALISALVIVWSQNFSWTEWLWNWLLDRLASGVLGLVSLVFGTASAEGLKGWAGWYGENQFKFTFWLLYLGAISDDLGLPNLKTVARWLWRRFRRLARGFHRSYPEPI
jgi:hypothetical protein